MRLLYLLLLFAAALVLQSSLAPFLSFGGLIPVLDLPLIVAVHVGVTRGKTNGMLAGLLLGYAQDALSGGIVGLNGFSKICAGFTAGLLREKLFASKASHRLWACFGAVFAGIASKLALLGLFGLPSPGALSLASFGTLAVGTLLVFPASVLLSGLEVRVGVRSAEELSFED